MDGFIAQKYMKWTSDSSSNQLKWRWNSLFEDLMKVSQLHCGFTYGR